MPNIVERGESRPSPRRAHLLDWGDWVYIAGAALRLPQWGPGMWLFVPDQPGATQLPPQIVCTSENLHFYEDPHLYDVSANVGVADGH